MVLVKSHYKNGLASEMISHYFANVLLLPYQFLVYFMLCSSSKGTENICPHFKKKGSNIKRIFHVKIKTVVNIYIIEFIQSIHWVRPVEVCFFLILRVKEKEKILISTFK